MIKKFKKRHARLGTIVTSGTVLLFFPEAILSTIIGAMLIAGAILIGAIEDEVERLKEK